jgi:hypothetical protein
MSDTIDITRAALRSALAAILKFDIPDQVTAAWVSKNFGISGTSVRNAIATGKLPAQSVAGDGDRPAVYLIRPEDCIGIWGHRLTNPRNDA